MLLLLLGCTETAPVAPPAKNPETPSTPVQPPDAASTAPTEERVYVQASSLNLRESPDSTGKKLGSLTVNSPLTVLERRDTWMRVRVDNGRVGWVAADFVDPVALTATVAMQRATEGPKEEQLSWWQRAAALDSSRTTLESLAAAYERAGDTAQAELIRGQLDWPVALFPPASQGNGVVTVEWSTGYALGNPRDIPTADWADFGINTDEPWWVLPSTGPALPATIGAVRVTLLSECSGEGGRIVELKIPPLRPHERVIAVHRGAPPKQWHDSLPASTLSVEEATLRAKKAGQAKSRGKEVKTQLVPAAKAWIGLVTWPSGRMSELGFEIRDGLTLSISEAETKATPLRFRDDVILGERDLTGDGQTESIVTDHCSTWVLNGARERLAETAETCCGC